MLALLTAVLALALSTAAPAPCAPSGVELRYQRPLGQVAEYRLSLVARGQQVDLGERIPVRIRAEIALREEVIGVERTGAVWLRVEARPVSVSDPTGTFGTGGLGRWPRLEFRIAPTGEVLGCSLAAGEADGGPATSALASLAAGLPAMVLPDHPVSVDDTWEWAAGGASQTSRLISFISDGEPVARIATEARCPITIDEHSEALGLTVTGSGEESETAETQFLVGRGLVGRQRGTARITTESEVVLSLPEETERLPLKSDLTVEFDLRLVRVDGEPISLP